VTLFIPLLAIYVGVGLGWAGASLFANWDEITRGRGAFWACLEFWIVVWLWPVFAGVTIMDGGAS
jgi:hypothetical protein